MIFFSFWPSTHLTFIAFLKYNPEAQLYLFIESDYFISWFNAICHALLSNTPYSSEQPGLGSALPQALYEGIGVLANV